MTPTGIDWSSSAGHHLENLERVLRKALRVFRSQHRGKQQRLGEHYLKTLPGLYRGFPMDLDRLCGALSGFVEDHGSAQEVCVAIEQSLADLPELTPPAELPDLPEGCKWEFIVLDDDATFVDGLGSCLDAVCGVEGHATKHVRSLPQLEKALSSNTDAVFLDLYDRTRFVGYQALDLVLCLQPETPVIVCTSDGRPETCWEMVRAGAASFLLKSPRGDDDAVDLSNLRRVLGAACCRRSTVPFHKPAALEVDWPPDLLGGNRPAKTGLLSSLFRGSRRVRVKRALDGGKSDADVVLVEVDDHAAPVVVKLASGERLRRERLNYLRYVRDDVGNSSGRVERQEALHFDRSHQGERATWAAVAYSLAGSAGFGPPQPLFTRFQEEPQEATVCLRNLLRHVLPKWYGRTERRPSRDWQALGRELGSVVHLDDGVVGPFEKATDSLMDDLATSGTVAVIRQTASGLVVLLEADRPAGLQVRVQLATDPGLWLREGRRVRCEGPKRIDHKRLGRLQGVLDALSELDKGARPWAPAIHGDLHLGNVLMQPGNAGQPWLIDFADTGPGCPLADLLRLEVDLVCRVMTSHVDRWLSLEEWASDMVMGRASEDLAWFGVSVSEIRRASRCVYESAAMSRASHQHYALLRILYCEGATRWFGEVPAFGAYLAACRVAAGLPDD